MIRMIRDELLTIKNNYNEILMTINIKITTQAGIIPKKQASRTELDKVSHH